MQLDGVWGDVYSRVVADAKIPQWMGYSTRRAQEHAEAGDPGDMLLNPLLLAMVLLLRYGLCQLGSEFCECTPGDVGMEKVKVGVE